MMAQLPFHVKRVLVLVASHVGCTRRLLNCNEETLLTVIPHERKEVFEFESNLQRSSTGDNPLPFSWKMFSYSSFQFLACFYLNRDLKSAALAADVTHADVHSEHRGTKGIVYFGEKFQLLGKLCSSFVITRSSSRSSSSNSSDAFLIGSSDRWHVLLQIFLEMDLVLVKLSAVENCTKSQWTPLSTGCCVFLVWGCFSLFRGLC